MKRLVVVLALLASPWGLAAQQAPPANTGQVSLSSASCPGTGCATLTVSGYASLAIQVTGTWVGTLTFQGTVDGTTYTPLNCTLLNGSSAVTTTTTTGTWTCSVTGLAKAQTLFTAYTSGTAIATMQTAFSGGGTGGGGGGGSASDVTIHDPSITTQKAAVNASGQLSITCANCSGSGASAVDNSAFTAGATSGAPAMGFFHATIDTVTDGRTAVLAMDSKRNLFNVIRDAAGNARGANVTAGNALLVDGSGATQPTNLTQLLGGTPDTNSGLKSVETLRVVLATDQPALTNKLLVTPDSVALPANQSVNVSQFNGTTVSMNTGVRDAGTQRVTISTNDLVPVTANAGTNLNTSALALDTSVNGLLLSQGSTTSGQKGGLEMGAVTTASPTYTTGQSSPLSLDTTGALRVTGAVGTTQYNEDSVHVDGDKVVFVGAIRRDTTPTSSAGSAGDYTAINADANGRVYTNTTLYDATGTAISLSTDATHNSAAVATGPQLMGQFDDVAPSSVSEDAAGRLRISANRNLYSTIRDAGGAERGANVNASNQLLTSDVITDLVPGFASTNLGKRESDVAANSDVGVAMLAMREDTPSSTAANGQYIQPKTDSVGRLFVNCATGCGGSGGTSVADRTGTFTPGTTTFTPAGGYFDDVATDTLAEGNPGTFRVSGNRNLYVTLRDAAGNERGLNIDASGQLAANVSQMNGVAVTMGNGVTGAGVQRVTIANDSSGNLATIGTSITPGTGAAHLGKAEDATHASGDTGVMLLCVSKTAATDLSVGNTDGDYEPCEVNRNGEVMVAANIQNASLSVTGVVLHDGAAGTFAPVLTGGRASAAVPTDVSADGDAVDGWYLRSGAQAIQPTFAGILGVAGNGASGTGVQRVTIANDSTGILALTTGSAQIGHLEANQSVNVAQINGVTPLMGNGASGTGAQRVTISNDSTGILALTTGSAQIGHLEANQSSNVAQINGVTPLMGNGVTGTGSPRVTLSSDTSSNTNPLYASAVGTSSTAATSGCYLVSAASTNATSCKGSAGNLYGLRAVNTTTTVYYLRLYNTAAAPTCSSATGFIESVPIPPAAASGGAGGIAQISDVAINYGTGIGFCFTGGSSSTDNTNAAVGVFAALLYK